MFDKVNNKKRSLEVGIIIGWVIIGIAFIAFLPSSTSGGPGLPFVMMGFVFLGVLITSYFTKQIKSLSNEFKQVYVAEELKKVFPNSTYQYDNGFSESFVVATKLLKQQDRFKSEDLITGEFDGVQFKCCDIHQQDVRSTGKSTTVVTVFQGRVYEFDFFKNFKYNLLLLQKGQFRPFENFNKVKMESIHFNSEYKIYAKNDHEAFYILTPHFMEKLLVLDRKYRDRITFSFLDNKLYIAVDNRVDNFDIKPFVPVDSNLIASYVEEFENIKEFIVYLTLNSRLFK